MTLEHIRETNGVYFFNTQHPVIKRLKKGIPSPEIHGDKIWSSSYFIMDYLEQNPLAAKSRVLEIGCGWGLLSIYCASRFGARATGVDADENVFPYLEVHAALNDVKVKTKRQRFENIKEETLARQDLIAGGDICFWDELVEPLYGVITKARKASVPKIIIADPGRGPFLKLAKRCKKAFGGKLLPWSVNKPRKSEGYLLVIENGSG